MIDAEGLICVKPNLRFIEGEVVGEVLKQMKEKKEKPAVAK
jgi:hypothetical protein